MKANVIVVSVLLAANLWGCVALGIGAAGGAAGGGIESSKAENRAPQRYGAGTYAATVLSNVVYFPAKVIFAGGGAVTSGAAFLLTGGDRKVSGRIWKSSVGGDYLVTPPMVAGSEPVEFVG